MATESPPSDESLLLQVQSGDHASFETLVRRHTTRYYNLAYRYMANRESAEDIVQIAFLKLFENPSIWNPKKEVKFTTWFYRIVVNLCLDNKKRHSALPLPESSELIDNVPFQEDKALQQEIQSLLEAEIFSLPDRQKTALFLCFYEDMSHIEAAKIMETSIQALQSLLMRAKTTLKEKMKEYLRSNHG